MESAVLFGKREGKVYSARLRNVRVSQNILNVVEEQLQQNLLDCR